MVPAPSQVSTILAVFYQKRAGSLRKINRRGQRFFNCSLDQDHVGVERLIRSIFDLFASTTP